MIRNLVLNWKTTSAGLTMLIGAWVHMEFALKNHAADESTWTTTLIATVAGVGLIAAGDADKSTTKAETQVLTDVVTQNSAAIAAVPAAIKSGDTTFIEKVKAPVNPPTGQTPKTP